MNLLLLPIAVAASILTYSVTYRVLKNFTDIGPPRLLALCSALLSGLGLLSLGSAVVTLILIPFATLGLALLIFALFRWLIRIGAVRHLQRFLDDNISAPPGHPPAPAPPSTGTEKRAPQQLHKTPQTKE